MIDVNKELGRNHQEIFARQMEYVWKSSRSVFPSRGIATRLCLVLGYFLVLRDRLLVAGYAQLKSSDGGL